MHKGLDFRFFIPKTLKHYHNYQKHLKNSLKFLLFPVRIWFFYLVQSSLQILMQLLALILTHGKSSINAFCFLVNSLCFEMLGS